MTVRKFMKDEATGRLIGAIEALPQSARDLLDRIGKVPAVRKKDAHPENWLVSEDGRLVMIDFESGKKQPVLYDLVLLLDDYPFIAADGAGWAWRLEQCRAYLDKLGQLQPGVPSLNRALVDDLYGLCLAFRCGVCLQRLRAPSADELVSSTTRAARLRSGHYQRLLHFLMHEHNSRGVRDFAGAVSTHVVGA